MLKKAGGCGGAQPPPPPRLQTQCSHDGFHTKRCFEANLHGLTKRGGWGGGSPPPPPPFANTMLAGWVSKRSIICFEASFARLIKKAGAAPPPHLQTQCSHDGFHTKRCFEASLHGLTKRGGFGGAQHPPFTPIRTCLVLLSCFVLPLGGKKSPA